MTPCAYIGAEFNKNHTCRCPHVTVPSCPFAPTIEVEDTRTVLTLRIQIKRHDGKRLLLSPDGHNLMTSLTSDGRPVPREHLVRAIGLAFAWRRELLRSDCSIDSLARQVGSTGVTAGRVHSILTLTRLSPTLLRSVLTGTLGSSITLADLLLAAQHLDWTRQAQAVGVGA